MANRQRTPDELLASVRRAGKRITTPKRTVATVLTSSTGHLTAEEITAKVQQLSPDVSTSTVYRILEEFEELDLVVHAHIGQQAAVYHLAELVHGHLTCDNCGATIEVPSEEFTALGAMLLKKHHFRLNIHHVGLAGLCAACQ